MLKRINLGGTALVVLGLVFSGVASAGKITIK